MTNFERWQVYTSGLASPQNYINWGYLYLISASLQRRCWMPPDWRRCYPNMYVTFVGKPGIGKGQVIRCVSDILTQHKLEDVKPPSVGKTPQEQEIIDAMHQSTVKAAKDEEQFGKDKSASAESPALIPMAADAVTYEALVQSMSRCIRRVNYHEYDEKQQKEVMRIYSHSSLCFCLEEIASLFRKNTESLVNFLIQAYDCGDNYEYVTKTQGKDRIRRLCLNFLGATNPDFMQDTFDDKLLSQGYSSRTFYIYAARNRKSMFFLPELTPEQKAAKEEISQHVKKLSQLYGQIKLQPGTVEFLEAWIKDQDDNPQKRASKSQKLDPYYARKNIHVMKVAMALHFGESTEMEIPLETFQRAIAFLAEEEKTMHLALVLEGKNPLANASARLQEYLRSAGPKTFIDLLQEFWGVVDKPQLTEILQYLQDTKMVTTRTERDQFDDQVMYYEIAKS